MIASVNAQVSVVGPTCVIDLLGEHRSLPPLDRGDLLAVLDVGGYGAVGQFLDEVALPVLPDPSREQPVEGRVDRRCDRSSGQGVE